MTDQQKYVNKLKGDRVLVIGGTYRGVGYAVAEACIEEGCTVIITGSKPESASSSLSKLHESYPSAKDRVSSLVLNLRSPPGSEDFLDKAISACLDAATASGTQKLDHIVFTAGDDWRGTAGPPSEITMAKIDAGFSVRIFGAMMLAKHLQAGQYMNPGPKSSFTMTGGGLGVKRVGMPGVSIVCAAGAALNGLTLGLANDLRPLRVNLVSLGPVETPLWRMDEQVRKAALERAGKACTTGVVGNVEDVAHMYLGVMKDRNCAGDILETDGGYYVAS